MSSEIKTILDLFQKIFDDIGNGEKWDFVRKINEEDRNKYIKFIQNVRGFIRKMDTADPLTDEEKEADSKVSRMFNDSQNKSFGDLDPFHKLAVLMRGDVNNGVMEVGKKMVLTCLSKMEENMKNPDSARRGSRIDAKEYFNFLNPRSDSSPPPAAAEANAAPAAAKADATAAKSEDPIIGTYPYFLDDPGLYGYGTGYGTTAEYSTITGRQLVPCKPHQYRDPVTNRCVNYTTFTGRHSEGDFLATFSPVFSKPYGKWIGYDTSNQTFSIPLGHGLETTYYTPSRSKIQSALRDGNHVWMFHGSNGNFSRYPKA